MTKQTISEQNHGWPTTAPSVHATRTPALDLHQSTVPETTAKTIRARAPRKSVIDTYTFDELWDDENIIRSPKRKREPYIDGRGFSQPSANIIIKSQTSRLYSRSTSFHSYWSFFQIFLSLSAVWYNLAQSGEIGWHTRACAAIFREHSFTIRCWQIPFLRLLLHWLFTNCWPTYCFRSLCWQCHMNFSISILS